MCNDGTGLAMGTRKMPPIAVIDKVLVQNQTGRAPNIWDKSGVIVECKPHDQDKFNDGWKQQSFFEEQTVCEEDYCTNPVASSGIRPSQFQSSDYGARPDMLDNQGDL